MVDHHVDRLGVEAQQCAKLTSTNRSIGLIASSLAALRCGSRELVACSAKLRNLANEGTLLNEAFSVQLIAFPRGFAGLVVMARDLAPDPISNSAVKALCADGTTS